MTTKRLFLADLAGETEDAIKDHIAGEYTRTEKKVLRSDLNNYDVLVAYESVGDFGCDSASYFLVRKKATGQLYEVTGGHCSCYGFEGQWDLQEVELMYLTSDEFHLGCGGYDNSAAENREKVKVFVKEIAVELGGTV